MVCFIIALAQLHMMNIVLLKFLFESVIINCFKTITFYETTAWLTQYYKSKSCDRPDCLKGLSKAQVSVSFQKAKQAHEMYIFIIKFPVHWGK